MFIVVVFSGFMVSALTVMACYGANKVVQKFLISIK